MKPLQIYPVMSKFLIFLIKYLVYRQNIILLNKYFDNLENIWNAFWDLFIILCIYLFNLAGNIYFIKNNKKAQLKIK